jgi:hypothetical protein
MSTTVSFPAATSRANPSGTFTASGCGICLDVAREAMQLHNAGSTLADIRVAIDRKYGSESPTRTPTPPVPK